MSFIVWILLTVAAVEIHAQLGSVSTLAGSCGPYQTMSDGTGTLAGFSHPMGMTLLPSNDAFIVSDSASNRLRKITLAGAVSTVVSSGLNIPAGLATDPYDLDYIILSDSGNHCLKRISIVSWTVTDYVGQCGVAGTANGPASSATFNSQKGIAFDSSKNLIIADESNNCIRMLSGGVVSTYAGACGISTGGQDSGPASNARFRSPYGVATDSNGNLFVTDTGNSCIRKIDSFGNVSDYSGVCYLGASPFSGPTFISQTSGVLYVSDTGNHCLRSVLSSGAVSTVAGTCGVSGSNDSAAGSSKFNNPKDMSLMTNGDVIIADYSNNCIRKLNRCSGSSSGSAFDYVNNICSCGVGYELRSGSCQLCLPSYYKSGVGNASCTQCSLGSQSNSAYSGCDSCINGTTYRSSLSQTSCLPCPSGATCGSASNFTCNLGFKKNIAGSGCDQCPVGTESSLDRSSCVACQTGYYRPSLADNACLRCPDNASCTTISFSCLSGFTPDINFTTCRQCPGSTYKSGSGNAGCVTCGLGFEVNLGKTNCISCGVGKTFKSIASMLYCIPCPSNVEWCARSAFLCSLGYVKNATATGCAQCPLGTESSSDRLSCVECASGLYRPSFNYSSCISCPSNAVCNPSSFSCNAGYYLDPVSGNCTICDATFYKGVVGNQTCFRCEVGFETDVNRTECVSCTAGKYRSDMTQPGCVVCPINSSCDQSSFSCSAGYQLSETNDDCIPCGPLSFRTLDMAQCTACPLNSECFATHFTCKSGYGFDLSTGSCKSCSSGFFKTSIDNSECLPCPVGSEALSNRTACIQCVAGTYRSQTEDACTPCPDDSTCDSIGFQCKSGHVYNHDSNKCLLSPSSSSVKQGPTSSYSNVVQPSQSNPVQQLNETIAGLPTNFVFVVSAVTILMVVFLILFCQKRRAAKRTHAYGEMISRDTLGTNLGGSLGSLVRNTDMPNEVTRTGTFDSSLVSSTNNLYTRRLPGTTTIKQGTTTMAESHASQGLSIPGWLQFDQEKDFRIGKMLTSGGNGMIFLGTPVSPQLGKYGSPIVLKKILKTKTKEEIDLFRQEVAIMSMCKENKFIAKLVGYSEKPYFILMKHYRLGSLESWFRSQANIKTKNLITKFLKNISEALMFLHSHGLAHCDIKPQNVLLDEEDDGELYCVLTDFGITRIVTRDALKVQKFQAVDIRGASRPYAAPELFKSSLSMSEPRKSDVYSTAVVIYRLVTAKQPWSHFKRGIDSDNASHSLD